MKREALIEIVKPYADMFSSEYRSDVIEHYVQFLEYITDEYNFCIVDKLSLAREYERLKAKSGESVFIRGRLFEINRIFEQCKTNVIPSNSGGL